MKWLLGMAMDLVVALSGAVAAIPVAREEAHWWWSRAVGNPSAFATYLNHWPAGRHAEEAATLHDEATWASLADSKDPAQLEAYLRDTRRDAHGTEARARIDLLRFEAARDRNTVRALQGYLDAQPAGRYADTARAQQTSLLADPQPYRAALDKASAEAMNEFIADFPGHPMQAQARVTAKDLAGRDLFELLREKKVQVKVSAAGAEAVSISLLRSTPHPLLATVAPGTLAVPRDAGWRQLLITAPTKLLLKESRWVDQAASAVSLQPQRVLRSTPDAYVLRAAAEQAPLTRLAAGIAEAGASQDVAQAAVWIASANADLAGLAALARQGGLHPPDPAAAAAAMQLVDHAGSPITARAIWRERQKIADALPAGEAKTWLEQRR